MRRTRVLLADDHQMLVDALKSVLEPRCEVVGSVTDGRSLLEAAEKLRPDVIVLDIAMPQLNGLDAGRKLQQKMPAVKLIYMTMNEDPYLIGEAFRAGGVSISTEAGSRVRVDRRDCESNEGREIHNAARCSGPEKYLAAGAQDSRTRPWAKQPGAGSYSTIGRRPHHERSSRYAENHHADGRRAQIPRHGTSADQNQRRTGAVRYQTQNHFCL